MQLEHFHDIAFLRLLDISMGFQSLVSLLSRRIGARVSSFSFFLNEMIVSLCSQTCCSCASRCASCARSYDT